MSKNYSNEAIQKAAHNIRRHLLKLTIERGGCYLGQACSSAEILSTLYMRILNLGPSQGPVVPGAFPGVPTPDNMNYLKGSSYHGDPSADFDRFFVSPAHYASAVYAALVECGRLSEDAMEKFNVDGWSMEMIGAEHSPGFETTAGSLGQTISIAAGTAHSKKLKNERGRVFVFKSDGEFQEGQTWEALQAASFYGLDNLVVYVDVNGQQVEGYTKDVMNIEPLASRCEAFGARVVKVDGHDIEALTEAAKPQNDGKPLVVLAYTSATQGIPLLEERKPFLHFVRLTAEEIHRYQAFYDQM